MHRPMAATWAELDEILMPGVYYYVIDGFDNYNSGYYTFTVVVTAP